ncbi:hypothetical protein ABFS82_06G166600 [Erythranthe guttata]
MAKYLFLCFILFACLFQEGKSCFIFPRIHVSIVNKLPANSEPLSVHCRSGDDDLGYHTLAVNQDFHFSFCVIPLLTIFYCDLKWETKMVSGDVFNAAFPNPCVDGTCVYETSENGVYINGKLWNSWY